MRNSIISNSRGTTKNIRAPIRDKIIHTTWTTTPHRMIYIISEANASLYLQTWPKWCIIYFFGRLDRYYLRVWTHIIGYCYALLSEYLFIVANTLLNSSSQFGNRSVYWISCNLLSDICNHLIVRGLWIHLIQDIPHKFPILLWAPSVYIAFLIHWIGRQKKVGLKLSTTVQ